MTMISDTTLTEPQEKKKKPTLRDRQKINTFNRLLDASIEVFREVGYRNATVEQIVNAAGANRATFYLHFKDKVGVAAALARRLTPISVDAYRKLAAMKAPDLAALEAWIRSFVKNTTLEPTLMYMLDEALAADNGFKNEYKRYLRYLAEKVMADFFRKFPETRLELIKKKFILLSMMLDRYTLMELQDDGTLQADFSLTAMAEIMQDTLFPELSAHPTAP